MAKPKPGGRRPRKRDRKNVSTGVVHIKSSFNNTIVTITDPQGNVIAWASSGCGRLQGQPQEHAVRSAARRRARPPMRAMEHGLRRAEVQVKGPGSGRDTAVRSIQNTGIEVVVDQGRHPGSPQRLPPAQAAPRLRSTDGSLHRSQGAPLAPPVHQHLREREGPQGARASSVPARCPRSHPPPQRRQRVPRPAAGEAEGEVHLRRPREAVQEDLQRGQPPPGADG